MKKTNRRTKIDPKTKFNILTDIKNQPEIFTQKTVPKIIAWIKDNYQIDVSRHTIYRWAKDYEFSYLTKRKQTKLSHSEALCRTNQRIRTLGIVIRNLCRELDIKHPSILDKLLDGIVKQYGEESFCESETQALENQFYDSI